jgi:hypothetical protein
MVDMWRRALRVYSDASEWKYTSWVYLSAICIIDQTSMELFNTLTLKLATLVRIRMLHQWSMPSPEFLTRWRETNATDNNDVFESISHIIDIYTVN